MEEELRCSECDDNEVRYTQLYKCGDFVVYEYCVANFLESTGVIVRVNEI